MKIEIKNEHEELNHFVPILAKIFIQRWDLYARQLDNGSYVCIKKQLRFDHLRDHLRGKITLGAYVLDQKSHAKYIVFDADNEDHIERLRDMAFSLKEKGVPSYLERSMRGGHLWLFFIKPIPGKKARLFGMRLKEDFDLTEIELFPKQDRIKTGPGSLIRMPFGVHRKTGERYGFFTYNDQPLATSLFNQIQILCTPETVPEELLKVILTQTSNRRKKVFPKGIDEAKKPLSERIKESISVYDFVGQFVELSPSGRGLCPFHNDHLSSFSVDIERNYWHCFAGCGGGSIVDFWMKFMGCDFKTAIHELACRLL